MYSHQSGGLQTLQKALWATRRLALYRPILDHPTITQMRALLELVGGPTTSTNTNKAAAIDIYHDLYHSLTKVGDTFVNPIGTDPWRELILESVLFTENLFSVYSSRHMHMEPDLMAAMRQELSFLGDLFRIDCRWLTAAVLQTAPSFPRQPYGLPSWERLITPSELGSVDDPIVTMKRRLCDVPNWADLTEALSSWCAVQGSGVGAKYHALRWDPLAGNLTPIKNPDPVKLDELVGYEWQRQALLDNTKRFIEGKPANNALLHGERGTGKSSTVKALVHEFGQMGLRVVELDKDAVAELPTIFRVLSGRGGRYILYIDDISFEGAETSYKALKSALEGSLEVKPSNVLVYATSNRRHIVREEFADRDANSEVHGGDGLQEKLSLADRFGLNLLYTTPNEEEYLHIVEQMVIRRGLQWNERVKRNALKWAVANGRWPRAARQFVETL